MFSLIFYVSRSSSLVSRMNSLTEPDLPVRPVRELVGLFTTPDPLEACIKALLAAGFAHEDLSVLSSHAAIEAADPEGLSWRDRLLPLLSESRYEVPLVAAGLIALASGPTGAIIAALVAAGVGGAALKEVFEEVTSLPDTEEYAAAVEAGELVLWIAVPDAETEARANARLQHHGARNIHLHWPSL